jgi:UDP-N-acetylmuramoyl-L-alanyl-D-glutamate--2,6-diaminopimelate ligase
MRLLDMLELLPIRPLKVAGDADVLNLTADSREAQPGAMFVLMPSARTDTAAYLPGARRSGATSVVVSTAEAFDQAVALGLAAVLFPSEGYAYNAAVSFLARAHFGDPSSRMRVIGVTGTNGKTTTAHLISSMLKSRGVATATLGTVGLTHPGGHREIPNTTPFPVELWAMLAEARSAGAETLVMEVSSHALVERRVAGLRLDVGVFTNLSQDHLDFHGSMERYAEAKRLMFTEVAAYSGKRFSAAINVDDSVGREYASQIAWPCVDFGLDHGRYRMSVDSVTATEIVGSLPIGTRFVAPIGGTFNASNLQAAAAALIALGLEESEVAESMSHVSAVPGRFESVPNGVGIHVIVDYAHTPDALEKLLIAARAVRPRRILTVFGCGGDRDATKRPLMAAAATRASDITILTSDNPRTEDPEAILRDVAKGATGTYEVIVDRPAAVRRAIELAEPGDLVVLAGKGHENYQIIGSEKVPMDDRDLAREALRSRCAI